MQFDKTQKIELIIIHPADPLGSKIGGAEAFIKDFIKYAPENFNIEFIGITSDKTLRPVGKRMVLNLDGRCFNYQALLHERNENKKTWIPLSFRFTLALKRYLHNFKDKIILFNRIEPAILFEKINTNKIAVIHTDIEKHIYRNESEVLWSMFPNLYSLFERRLFRQFSHVYSVSNNTFMKYQEIYSEIKHRFSFLPSWVDTKVFYPASEARERSRHLLYSKYPQLSLYDKWILFIGRLQKVKSPLRLVDTFSEYFKNNSNSCLIVIGEGNLLAAAKEESKKKGIFHNVLFLGQKHKYDLVNYYRSSDCLLLTSNFEGMPITIMEALACGLPVVTTNVGEVNRVVKNGFSGEVVNSFEPAVLAGALNKVLSNSNIYSKENCASCIRDYSPEKILRPVYEKISELYSNIISR